MKCYVASSIRNIPATREAQEALKALGHTITYDWVPSLTIDETLTPLEQVKFRQATALAEIRAVSTADFVLILAHPSMKGGWVEMGIALVLHKPIIFIKAPFVDSIFTLCPNVETVDTLDGALAYIKTLRTSHQ